MIRIYCDFDGTITNRDSIVFLTERFGGGEHFRKDIFDQIVSGKLTVYEAIEAELGSVRASWQEAVIALKENIQIDPGFIGLVEWSRQQDFYLAVVSSGTTRVIKLFLEDLQVPVFAHSVEIENEEWRYRLNPEMQKTQLLSRLPDDDQVIYVGDGTSDVEVLPLVDLVFATSYLARYCDSNRISYVPFDCLQEVHQELQNRVETGELPLRVSNPK